MSEIWLGIGKVIEECGEVLQLAGKIIPFPTGEHPDGKGKLQPRIVIEIADLYAALDYFVSANKLPMNEIEMRRMEKLYKFNHWGLTGIHKKEST